VDLTRLSLGDGKLSSSPKGDRYCFAEFEAAFGNDPLGNPASLARRTDTGEEGCFRRFSRDWIAERGDNLDIAWLKDERENDRGKLPEPVVLAQEAMGELAAAMAELWGILQELGEEISL
jgi:type I restriction enzyme M protein